MGAGVIVIDREFEGTPDGAFDGVCVGETVGAVDVSCVGTVHDIVRLASTEL